MNEQPAIVAQNIKKMFGSFVAVNSISFAIKKGEVFGFLGPNGAGKSTTIRMLCGIISPTSGKGYVAGYDISRQQEKIKQSIGYMSQRFSLYNDLTVEENMNFYSGIYRVPLGNRSARKSEILNSFGLEPYRQSITRNLSIGIKQRLALGCAIIHQPPILFLDEPTSGTDPISRKSFWETIKKMSENGVTVFVTTHYMDEAENCDRLSLIYKGDIIAEGAPSELKSAGGSSSLEDVFVSLIQAHDKNEIHQG
jgi:ABC-2 type transport system ATP-binding protein